MDPIFIKPKASDDTGISDFSMEHLSSVKLILAANDGNKLAREEIQRRHDDRVAKGMRPIPAVLKFLQSELAKSLASKGKGIGVNKVNVKATVKRLASKIKVDEASDIDEVVSDDFYDEWDGHSLTGKSLKALVYFRSNEGDDFKICDIKEINTNVSRNLIEIYNGEVYRLGTTNKISLTLKNETSSLKVVKYKNIFFRFDSFLWYFLYGSYVNDFIYLDGDISNITVKNLLPKPFKCASLKFSKSQMEEMFEYNPDDGCLYWFHINSKNHLWNDLLPFEVANRIYDGNNYVDINGDIYLAYDVVNKLCEFNLPNQFQPLDGDKKNLKASNLIGEAGDDIVLQKASDFVSKYSSSYNDDHLVVNEPVGRNREICCFYCGDNTSMTRDHVIPVSYSSVSRSYNKRDTVPCCLECNVLLGNRWLLTVEDRAAYLADRLARRHKGELSLATFTTIELSEFGPRLQSMLMANINNKAFIMHRIDHCHNVAGSLYEEGEVNHLRGITTDSKRSAYVIVDDFLSHLAENPKHFCDRKSKEVGTDADTIKSIINESLHPDVAIQYKFDHKYPLDISLKKIRSLLMTKYK